MNKTKYTKAVCMLVTTVLLTTLMSGCSIAGISNTWSELKGSLVGNNYNITFYDNYGELDFGVQFHGFDYPDETGVNELGVRFWNVKMVNGIINFDEPSKCQIKRSLRKMNMKNFDDKINFLSLSDDICLQNLLNEVR